MMPRRYSPTVTYSALTVLVLFAALEVALAMFAVVIIRDVWRRR